MYPLIKSANQPTSVWLNITDFVTIKPHLFFCNKASFDVLYFLNFRFLFTVYILDLNFTFKNFFYNGSFLFISVHVDPKPLTILPTTLLLPSNHKFIL